MQQYQSIAKVSKLSGFSVPTLRFYEQEGLIPHVPRDGAGNRMYGERELSRINTIRCLRAAGLTLPDMKRYFAMGDDGEESVRVRKELMESTKESLVLLAHELQRCLTFLSMKIEHYEAMLSAMRCGQEPPAFHPEKFNKLFAGETC